MLKLVTFSSLYPNEVTPRHGIFVEGRLRQLVATGQIEVIVLAAVPWFPFRQPIFGRYAGFARVPAEEQRHGLRVWHPRYPVLPKIGMSLAPLLMAAFLLPRVRVLKRKLGAGMVIDSHFLYPDGVAATLIGRWLGVPVVMTARGSDVTQFTQYRIPRALILWAARECNAIVTVSASLKQRLCELGVEGRKVIVLRNGVDLDRFRPMDRVQARRELGVDGPLLLSVGNLLELKGHHLVLQAVAQLANVRLIIVGEGPMRDQLVDLIRQTGTEGRIKLLSNVAQDDLVKYYNAADALVLASSTEGMPNVVLESMACGTPVIATMVGGVPEVMTGPAAGFMLKDRSAAAIVEAYQKLTAQPWDRAATRVHAEKFGWPETLTGLLGVFRHVTNT